MHCIISMNWSPTLFYSNWSSALHCKVWKSFIECCICLQEKQKKASGKKPRKRKKINVLENQCLPDSNETVITYAAKKKITEKNPSSIRFVTSCRNYSHTIDYQTPKIKCTFGKKKIILDQLRVPLCDGERAVACVQDYCNEQACKLI